MGIVKRIYKSLRRDDDRYFRTRNLHLATILFAQNFTLVNVGRSDPANRDFVFRNSFDIAQMVERSNSRNPIFVDAGRFCGFRGKAVTIPGRSWSAFRNEAGDDSGMKPASLIAFLAT